MNISSQRSLKSLLLESIHNILLMSSSPFSCLGLINYKAKSIWRRIYSPPPHAFSAERKLRCDLLCSKPLCADAACLRWESVWENFPNNPVILFCGWTYIPWDLETLGPWHFENLRPRYFGTLRPWDPETWRPWDLKTLRPQDLESMRPWDPETSDLKTFRLSYLCTLRPYNICQECTVHSVLHTAQLAHH